MSASPAYRTSPQSLREASPEVKRQFGLRVEFDKAQRRIAISATVTEAVGGAFENTKALQAEGFQVTARDIAGARHVRGSDARIAQHYRLAR
jgi:hypothetical protein